MKVSGKLIVLAVLVLFSLSAAQDDKNANEQKVITPEKYNILMQYEPSGFMGDGKYNDTYVKQDNAWRENPHSGSTCIKVTYSPGPDRWGGLYWQNLADNWGGVPGNDFSKKGFTQITFWARGEKGGEIIEFKAGGIHDTTLPHKDSFTGITDPKRIELTTEWVQYTIDLQEKDLSGVIGGFCWVAAISSNPNGVTFYYDDVFYE